MRKIFKFLYKRILKPVVFMIDPEAVHDFFIWFGEKLGKVGIFKSLMRKLFVYQSSVLEQEILGVKYKNPIGLAAGFDKDARLTQVLSSVGFGFHEIGSITAKPYDGNPKPRLKRFPKTQTLWVNYGLKNKSAKVIRESLEGKKFKIPIWTSAAKTNCKETVDVKVAVEDHCETLKHFSDITDVFVVNISCPNAFGGQPFHKPEDLEPLLSAVDAMNLSQPIFVKISPDLSSAVVDSILEVCDKHKVDGFILTNLRKDKKDEDFEASERGQVETFGGMSGKYVEFYADRMLKYLTWKMKRNECKKYVLVGLGGVFSAEDAYKKIRLGASLVQLITGMIFEGPQVIAEINQGLVKLLEKDGFKHISEAVGVDV